jgi:hypothetical protein
MAIAELLSLFPSLGLWTLAFYLRTYIYGRRRTMQPQLPVWANFSILYGLVEFGNRSATAGTQNAGAHDSLRRAYRILWPAAKIQG